MKIKSILFALLAAALFGISVPYTKVLLPQVSPELMVGSTILMVGTLSLGAGVGLGLCRLVSLFVHVRLRDETPLSSKNLPCFLGTIFSGGLVAPILLLIGLQEMQASSASLLLNFEGVFTALLAWLVFKETRDVRVVFGAVLIVVGAVFLSWMERPTLGTRWAVWAVFGTCMAWAIDNNLTRKISGCNPVQVSMLRGWLAGVICILLGLCLRHQLPTLNTSLKVGLIGFWGYGISYALLVPAFRLIGAARATAYFSAYPFVGAVFSVLFLGNAPNLGLVIAGLLMACGVFSLAVSKETP